MCEPARWWSHGHSEHRTGFNVPEHPFIHYFSWWKFPVLRKINVPTIKGLTLPWGEAEAWLSLPSTCSNSHNFPVPAPSIPNNSSGPENPRVSASTKLGQTPSPEG